jgi:hypothetical protein
MVDDLFALMGGGLCGADVHVTVYLKRVAGQDLSVEAFCQSHTQCALARRSGSDNRDRRIIQASSVEIDIWSVSCSDSSLPTADS